MLILKILAHTSMNLENGLLFSKLLCIRLNIWLELDTKIWIIKVTQKTTLIMSRF